MRHLVDEDRLAEIAADGQAEHVLLGAHRPLAPDRAGAIVPIFAVGQPSDPRVVELALAAGEARVVEGGLSPVGILRQVEQRLVHSNDGDAVIVRREPFGEFRSMREHALRHVARGEERFVGHFGGGQDRDPARSHLLGVERRRAKLWRRRSRPGRAG